MRNKNHVKIKVMEGFDLRLKEALERKSFSQTSLSHMLGSSQVEVSNYVNGKALPRPIALQKLSFHLGIDQLWLISGYGDKTVSYPYSNERFHCSFSDRLIWLLWQNNSSIADLDELFNGSTSQYTTGARIPNLERIETLANYFNVSLQWLKPKSSDGYSFTEFLDRFCINSKEEFFYFLDIMYQNKFPDLIPNRVSLIKQFLKSGDISLDESTQISDSLNKLNNLKKGKGRLTIDNKHTLLEFFKLYFVKQESPAI